MTATVDGGTMARMFLEGMPDDATPTPELVAAWLVLNTLHAEAVPMWAAYWLVQGYDGQSLAAVAGLDGRDTREVRDLLPAALEDAAVAPVSTREAGLKVAYDHIARMHFSGRASWGWAVDQVVAVVIANGYASEVFEQPMGALYGIDDELGEPWDRTEDELARIVRDTCIEQTSSGPARPRPPTHRPGH